MLAFIFRGVFLLGVISWYSTSVWKMIDGYFKDRFENYLRAEYDKNPHMLADIKAYRAAGGKESPTAPIPEEEVRLNEVVQACTTDICLVNNKHDSRIGGDIPVSKEAAFGDHIDIVEPETTETTKTPPVVGENEIIKEEKSPEVLSGELLKNDSAKRGNVEKKKTSHLIAPGKDQEGKAAAKKKKRLKTITLTEEDFASTRIKVTPQDFAEFDLDEDAAQSAKDEPVGILVSELPFKPKLDIGDLRKVSPEEFCPLTLDDEFSCDETKTWP